MSRFYSKVGLNFLICFLVLNSISFIELLCKIYSGNQRIRIGIPFNFFHLFLDSDGNILHGIDLSIYFLDFSIIYLLFLSIYTLYLITHRNSSKHRD